MRVLSLPAFLLATVLSGAVVAGTAHADASYPPKAPPTTTFPGGSGTGSVTGGSGAATGGGSSAVGQSSGAASSTGGSGTASAGSLPFTGAGILPAAGAGAALLLTGGGLLIAARRRSTHAA